VDATLEDDKKPGGLGAILTQIIKNGEHCIIAYASWKLQKHERYNKPFLLEMQVAIWGMEHFVTYLRGRRFTLYKDHRPLEKFGKVHTKTLNRLQESMNTFDFSDELLQAQAANPLSKALKSFLQNKELLHDPKCQSLVRLFSNDCFIEDGLVWCRIKCQFEPSQMVLFLPASLVTNALTEAHGELLTGHYGIYKMKERLMQCCQLRCRDDRPPPTLLSPLPLPTKPGQ